MVSVASETLNESMNRAAEQTAAYGHDSGYFRIGRDESSHEIGCRGELIAKQFLEDRLPESATVSLNPLGHVTDLSIHFGNKNLGMHVKTGLYRTRPRLDQPFGVHFGQRLEMTGSALLLISLMRDDSASAIVEGYLAPDLLAAMPIIRKGDRFPGRSYTSRTDNRLTYIREYQPITGRLVRQMLTSPE